MWLAKRLIPNIKGEKETNDVIQSILNRRSIRSYRKEKKLNEQQIQTLIEVILASPSAKNNMPWHVSVIQNEDILKKMAIDTRTILEANGNNFASNWSVFFNAPCAFLISRSPIRISENRHWETIDCGIVAQNLALAAYSMGLSSCIVGYISALFDPLMNKNESQIDRYRSILEVPEKFEVELAVIVGYGINTRSAHTIKEGKISRIK